MSDASHRSHEKHSAPGGNARQIKSEPRKQRFMSWTLPFRSIQKPPKKLFDALTPCEMDVPLLSTSSYSRKSFEKEHPLQSCLDVLQQ